MIIDRTSEREDGKILTSLKNAEKRQENFFETCNQCKTSWSCCHETTPPITEARKAIIETYLKARKIHFRNPFVKTEYTFPRLDHDGYCVFHDRQTRKCLVHPVKPETCVAGPITFDIRVETGKIEWFIKMEKICQLAAIVYDVKLLMRTHVRSAKKEILRLVNQLDSEALKAILKRDESETFKIGEEKIGKNVLNKLCRTELQQKQK